MATKFFLCYFESDDAPPPPPELDVTTTFLPNGQVGVPYNVLMAATGGAPPYTWAAIEALPDGLLIDSATGAVSGIPTAEGDFTPRLQVTDSLGAIVDSGTLPVSIASANAVLRVTTTTLPHGQVNQPYTARFAAIGGTPPYSWAIVSGAIPGVSLNPTTGDLTGVPTTQGSYGLTVMVTDAASGTATSGVFNVTITAVAAVQILTTNLTNGEVGEPYSRTISITGGDEDYTLSVSGGALPGGLSLVEASPSVWRIEGTPSGAGSFAFTLRAVDGAGLSDEQDLTMTVVPVGTLVSPHEYFNDMTTDYAANLIKAVPLLSQADLNTYAQGGGGWWVYNPGNDVVGDDQDATQFIFPYLRRYNEAERVEGKIVVTGNQGAIIPRNATFVRASDNHPYIMVGTKNVTIPVTNPPAPTNTVKIVISSTAPIGQKALGVATNGTVINFVTTPSGVNQSAVIGPLANDRVRVLDTHSIPGNHQIRVPIGIKAVQGESILYIWDFYWHQSWRTNVGSPKKISAEKCFNIIWGANATDIGTSPRWTTLLQVNNYQPASVPTQIGVDSHAIGSRGALPPRDPNKQGHYNPTGQGTPGDRTYPWHYGVWTRYWVEIKPYQPPEAFTEWSDEYLGGATLNASTWDPLGRYHMTTVWIADENRDPIPVLYRVPMSFDQYSWITRFDLEFNNSDATPIPGGGDWLGYARGIHLYKNIPLPANAHLTETDIFKRPVRG